jgi:hypothetical protein
MHRDTLRHAAYKTKPQEKNNQADRAVAYNLLEKDGSSTRIQTKAGTKWSNNRNPKNETRIADLHKLLSHRFQK